MGVFLDPKKDTRNTASLTRCDCKDFNFSGNSPRKSFKPCMHIYRLAMELGLLEMKYEDSKTKDTKNAQQKKSETLRLQNLNKDLSNWGAWNSLVHESGIQKNRQYRGYIIIADEFYNMEKFENGWVIHDYYVTLETCECGDFISRSLPCKHIYAVALASGVALPLTQKEFVLARDQGQETVFIYEEA